MVRLAILLFGVVALLAMFAPHVLEGGPSKAVETVRADGGIALRLPQPAASEPMATATGDGARLRRDRSGHFRTQVQVNGQAMPMLVDTGASVVVIDIATARKLGITPSPRAFTGLAQTVSGTVRVAPVTLDSVAIGSVRLQRVSAAVVEGDSLPIPLLGQSFLRRLNEVTIRGDEMILR